MDEWSTATLVAGGGAIGGAVLGLAARLGKFCTLAAIEDAIFGRDFRRLRMWAFAMAVALMGVAVLSLSGTVDFSRSLYHAQSVNPLAWIIGGLAFGLGMALCGTCGFGILARLGGGDLRALFDFLILGIAAYMAIAGPTALLRISLLDPLALDGAVGGIRTLSQIPGEGTAIAGGLALLFACALVTWCLQSRRFRRSIWHLGWSLTVGFVIIAGWWTTGWLGADAYEPQPLVSHTYSAPLGQTIIYFMTMSGATITFGVGATLGVIVGGCAGALAKGEFRWEAADDAREMRRHIVGALLMGTGGVYAGGCTIGQGLSAASILAISTPVVLVSIWCGAWLGLNYLMEGSVVGAVRALTGRQAD